ncbi:MAG TPA: DUF3238 domain-containing protein [Planococcus sp. (in: firmicutes)]|nr:DUF3238 domain-containing protein [Planococcus sp. (in: firmicutes)]
MNAKEDNLEIELLHQTDTIIEFKWTPTGDTCKVQRNAETIYTGTGNSFQDTGLEPGELYTYTLERLDASGNTQERVKMRTSTENRAEDCNNLLERAAVTAIVSNSKTALAWSAIEGLQEFDIYRDGRLIGTAEQSQFSDYGASKDIGHTYQVSAKRPLEQSESAFSKGKSLAASIFGLLNIKSSKEEAAMEKFRLTFELASADYLLSGSPTTDVEDQNLKWDFRYSTFLPDDYLLNPNLLSFNRYFSGDDRGFDADASDYRTQVNFNIDLKDSEAALNFTKDIGISIAYDWRKKFRKADVASADDVYLEKVEEGDRNVTVQLHHSVGNPLTPSPTIDYDVAARFYRDSHYDIAGMHDQAPNHEVYLRKGGENGWKEIHQAESKGLAWMSDAIASQYWRIFNFH